MVMSLEPREVQFNPGIILSHNKYIMIGAKSPKTIPVLDNNTVIKASFPLQRCISERSQYNFALKLRRCSGREAFAVSTKNWIYTKFI